ncbi:protein phosphatase 1 regulatory subunit 42-like isoform X5 [Mya arenaria]|uniref:protein phosphatase 1 regulatory subunit 42-like isoform X5 n=1 Tax=Mya arenaria TaxID=6604 RepID=UPI0022DF44AF|nr:protein phosphatase 1 regulatory subunit 42-like isoform X5 [Mya arenaria]XP_052778231.1 protein phosphatase 1 regulatory subunit 42-like isoform X5 [Mya arenaria]
MVKLTIDLIARGTSGYTKKKRDETMNHYLKRLTHLYLENKCIDEVGEDMSMCRNLSVLYLYDNQLTSIPALHHNQFLTMLYLQNNHISRVEGLQHLHRLTKLYLGGNSITVVEGLEKLEKLQELHLENQSLPPGEKLLFDPRSLKAISGSLKMLNISGNNLDSIRDLECLRQLSHFIAIDNNLNDMKELAHVFGQWYWLTRLDLMGNPLCHKAKYRDRVIVMAKQLDTLDGKQISETAKQFLKNWHANKETQKQKRMEVLRRGETFLDDYRVGEAGGDLPPVRDPSGRTGTIPGYMMPENIIKGLPRKQFDELLARTATLADQGFQRSAPVKARSGLLRSKNPADITSTSHTDVYSGSAPPRRRPLMSVSFSVSGNFNPTKHIQSDLLGNVG